MASHAQLKFVMTECSKTQIRLTGLIWQSGIVIITVSDKEEEKKKSHDKKPDQPKFVVSKWETIDETELEAQGNISLFHLHA